MQYEALNQWHFVIAAYVIGLGGCLALLVQSWVAMRRAERRRDAGREQGRERGSAPVSPSNPTRSAEQETQA